MYQDPYQDFEARGREAVIKFLESRPGFHDFSPTIDRYNPIDLYCFYDDQGVAIEIKTRKTVYQSGQIIEETKLQGLFKALENPAIQWAYYVNVVGLGLYFWPITERLLSLRIHRAMLPATTATASESRVKAYRLLPLSWATFYSLL